MKHWTPRIAEAVEAALAAGATPLVGLVLAPHYSRALDRRLPRPARGCARGSRRARASSTAGTTSRVSSRCSPTASATPTRTSSSPRTRCPRASSTRATRTATSCSRPSRLVADSAGIEDWSFSFQSESPTGEPWLGPDILDHLADLPARGIDDVLVCPVGFVVGSSGDPLGHRQRGAGAGRASSVSGSTASRCRTTTPLRRGARRRSCGARSRVPSRERRARSSSIASRGRFRVYPRESRALKDLVVARGRARARDVAGAPRRLARVEPGERCRARRPKRLRQVDAAALDLRDHQADGGTRRSRRARRLAARARRRLPPGLHRPRERLPERLDPRPLRAAIREVIDEIVSFAAPVPRKDGTSRSPALPEFDRLLAAGRILGNLCADAQFGLRLRPVHERLGSPATSFRASR